MKNQNKPSQLRKDKVLEEVKLVDGLFKYKQSQVYVLQGKLRLSFFKEEYDSPIADHKGERTHHHRMVSRRYHWRCIKEDIVHFVNAWMKCQVNRASYQKQSGLLQPLPILPGPWHSICMDLITSLLESQGYDAILLMVKRLANLAHMVPIVRTATALETA